MATLHKTGHTVTARVAILGAESSGKSSLASALATQYQGRWVPEHLREFVDTHRRTPQEHEQAGIARTQLAREDMAAAQAWAATEPWLFCDTTPLMTLIYSQHYWGRIPEEVAQLADDHGTRYALTLVTAPDGLWVPDGLQRESMIVQQTIHARLLAQLTTRALPWQLVSGSLTQRLQQVQHYLESARRAPPSADGPPAR